MTQHDDFDATAWLEDMFGQAEPADVPVPVSPEEAPYGLTANGRPVPGGFEGTLAEFLDWLEEQLSGGGVRRGRRKMDALDREVQVIETVTGGWSDDEALLGRIPHHSMFGWKFWESTHRGGLTVYEIPVGELVSDHVTTWLNPPSDVFETVPENTTLVVLGTGAHPDEVRIELPQGAQLRYRETDRSTFPRSGELIVEPRPRLTEPWAAGLD